MGYQDCVQFPHSHALLLSFKKSSGWDRTDFIIFKGCINGHITRRNVSDTMRRSDYRHSHEAKNIQKTRHLWQLLEYFQFYYMKNYEKQRYLVVLAIYLMFHRKTEGVSKDPEGTALSNFVTRFNKNQFSLRINCIRSFHISSIFSY